MDDELRAGLSSPRKTTPPELLYDALGSALFEAITLLPEYPIARRELALLESHAAEVASIVASQGDRLDVVELGPGHGRKARVVLERLAERPTCARFIAVDVSEDALHACARDLADVAGGGVVEIQASFLEGLARSRDVQPQSRRLALFLGSNLSNIERREAPGFLSAMRESLSAGDWLLMSVDLDKPLAQLLPAYDDSIGLTAAFNLNVLSRLNREQGAHFDLTNFAHEARWNERERRIEMHLRARNACTVNVERLGLELRFDEGETLWTESSHRFSLEEIGEWADSAGFSVHRSWISEGWSLALILLRA